MCRGTPAPRRNLCAGDEHKPKESTFKKKTLWSLHTIPYLALNDGILCLWAPASQPAPNPVARPIKGPRSHLGDHPRSLQAASGRRSGEPLDLGVVDDEAEDGLAHITTAQGLATLPRGGGTWEFIRAPGPISITTLPSFRFHTRTNES